MRSVLPDTFCVFILTHGRSNNVVTLKTLERCGYTGRLYLVVDDEDKTVEQYRRNFGAERVIHRGWVYLRTCLGLEAWGPSAGQTGKDDA